MSVWSGPRLGVVFAETGLYLVDQVAYLLFAVHGDYEQGVAVFGHDVVFEAGGHDYFVTFYRED